MTLKAETAFDEITKRAKSQPDLVKKIGAVIVFDITKNGKNAESWSKKHAFTPCEQNIQ